MKPTLTMPPSISLLLPALLACGARTEAPGPTPEADGPPTCDADAALPAQLRLLTRREYNATVIDLFGFVAASGPELEAASCDDTADCLLSTSSHVEGASCVEGACAQDPCTTATFVLQGWESASRVHVAGSFNGWPSTIAAGGLSLTWEPSAGLWWAKVTLEPVRYEYKFVVDESTWLADPANPDTAEDGYGGLNSVLTLSCDGDTESAEATAEPTGSLDFSAGFPVESRPEAFPFDDHAASALVTSVAAEAQLDAAEAVAARALAAPSAWLSCDPDDATCLSTFFALVAPRVFRRPLSEDEQARYTALAAMGSDPRDGLSLVLTAMLASPAFLYRSEIGSPEPGEPGAQRLDDYEVATALSYALIGSTPDNTLLAAAASGALADPAGREAEAARLLGADAARAHVGGFVVQWLGVEVMETAAKSEPLYGVVTDSLRQAMVEEAAAFGAGVILDGSHTVSELYTSQQTYANAELGALYGLSLEGDDLRPVHWLPGQRAGLLGLSGVLASLAHSDQSAPVQRGAWVRQRLLCQELPPPPADIPTTPEASEGGTTRERFEQHSQDPACSSCHQYLDPVGFGFEHFDAMGGWRDQDDGRPVDASGAVLDLEWRGAGTTAAFDGVPALATLLAESPAAERCVVTQLSRFASGGETADLCLVDSATAAYRQTGDLREAIAHFVTADAFLRRELP